jgi:spore maturation protein CgeB
MARLDQRVLESRKMKGYEDGWRHGYRLGRCQAVIEQIPEDHGPVLDKTVLYIPQGFPAIDEGIVDGLRRTVARVIVGDPNHILPAAEAHQPDLVLVLNGMHNFPAHYPDDIDRLRLSGIKTAVWFADDPYYSDLSIELAPHYEYVFTHELAALSYYQEAGASQVYYLPLAVHEGLFRPMPVSRQYMSDVCFIGTGFPNRIALFNQLVPYLAHKKVVIVGALWHHLKQYRLLSNSIIKGWMPAEETAKYYNGASIVINCHRSPIDPVYNRNSREMPAYSINPRTYEISACGTLQLTDIRQDLFSLYTPEEDLITYETADELIEKIENYLQDEEERRNIALQGLKRTMQEHTFATRIRRMMQIIFG